MQNLDNPELLIPIKLGGEEERIIINAFKKCPNCEVLMVFLETPDRPKLTSWYYRYFCRPCDYTDIMIYEFEKPDRLVLGRVDGARVDSVYYGANK
jgi:hypothetical protein